MGVPGLRVDGRDHSVRGDLPGDPPRPAVPFLSSRGRTGVGAGVGVGDPFDVLAGDQAEQPDCVSRGLVQDDPIVGQLGHGGQHRGRRGPARQ